MKRTKADIIRDRAAKYQEKHVRGGYYFEPDHGDVVCRKCLNRLIRAGLVADDQSETLPAWHYEDPSAERDGLQWCEASSFKIDGKAVGCGVMIEGWLTDHGACEELALFEEHGFSVRRHQDCYIWDLLDVAFVTGSEEKKRLFAMIGEEVPS